MYFSMRKNTVHTRADGLACMLDWTGLAGVVGLELGLKLGLELGRVLDIAYDVRLQASYD